MFLYDGSESASSGISQDDQQDFRGLIEEAQMNQEAKQYFVKATKHLLEMCIAYSDDIDETDNDEVLHMIVEAVGSKSIII